jgi:ABC-2 type transport system ATP-binding protein
MSTDAIEVDGVWKTFRIFHNRNSTLKQAVLRRRRETFEEFWALRDVSFGIPAGSSFGIIGANGAGNSTMLKVLARILVPDKGAVRVDGRVSALLELGAGFHPELSGRENVFLNGNILGMSSSSLRSKFDEIVSFSGLEEFIDQPVKTYSSGMFARLGFSVAVAVEPDVLLVDEVLAVGDEQFQRRCTEKMGEIRSSGRTVVFVSHGLAQVQQLCDHAVWLDKGEVQVVGDTNKVVQAYLESVTTSYRLDDRGRQRTGSGEIQLEVELLPDPLEEPVVTGSPLTVRMHWMAEQTVENLVFGFSIRAADGYEISGSSNVLQVTTSSLGPGEGWLDYTIPRVMLLPGSYHVSAAITEHPSGHVFDHSPNIVEFDVAPRPESEIETGIVTFDGQWHRGNTAP